jgi:pepF/M3 family oligoendopeptidase
MRWNLDLLYKGFDTPEFLGDFKSLREKIAELNDWAGENLKDGSNALEKIESYIKQYCELFDLIINLHGFASLTASADSSNEAAKKYFAALLNAISDSSATVALFYKFIGGVPDLDALIEKSHTLKEHEFVLMELKEKSAYSLTEREELIISKMSNTGANAWGQMKEELYSSLSASVPGAGESLSMPAVRNLAYDGRAELRKAAYVAELEAYKKIEVPAAYALNCIKGQVIDICRVRGYESPLDMTLKNSRVDRETFDAMISAMKDALPSFRRYFRKKASLLGHKGALPFYDLFAPVGKVEMTYSYDEAADFVVKNFSSFSKILGDFAKFAFENAWIDAEPRSGKRGGAFCAPIPSKKQSRVLSSFSGSFSCVTTLAHELGHAFHALCIENEDSMNREYTMPIAETASTFCETLVCDAAIKTAAPDEALVIMENDIMGVSQTIVDIYSRFLFEDEVFNRRADSPLSVDEFKEIMLKAQKEVYGDGLDENFLHPYMWLCKPHYYSAETNYYNWPYAYGQLFSKGLYSEFLKQGPAFVPKYESLLAATGKNNLRDIAKLVDIDTHDKAFWAASIKLTENDIDKFCGM